MEWSFHCQASLRPSRKIAPKRVLRSRSKSSAEIPSRNSTTPHLRTRCTFSTFCRPTVSAITTRAPASTFLPANCSPVSLGGCEAQVKGHVAANLNVGHDRARLIYDLTQLLPFIGYPRMLNALRVVNEVTAS